MDLFFEAFTRERAADFKRIAAATKGEMDARELISEAYIMALQIGEREGRQLSLVDPADQRRILGSLFTKYVKRSNRVHRHALSFRASVMDDDGDGYDLVDGLAGPEDSDPLEYLLQREEMEASNVAIHDSYSQATAYAIMFSNLGNSMEKACAYLVVPRSTLRGWVVFAIAAVKVQPSIFDRIERIPDDFMPLPGKAYAIRLEQGGGAGQLAWEFEDAPA